MKSAHTLAYERTAPFRARRRTLYGNALSLMLILSSLALVAGVIMGRG